MTDPRTQEDVSALSDADLTERVAVEVMGWNEDEGPMWIEVAQFSPLTDANDRDRVVERLREVWAASPSICVQTTVILFGTGFTRSGNPTYFAEIRRERLELTPIVIRVEHASLNRAICEAAVRAFNRTSVELKQG
jgi:hypothetical protein